MIRWLRYRWYCARCAWWALTTPYTRENLTPQAAARLEAWRSGAWRP